MATALVAMEIVMCERSVSRTQTEGSKLHCTFSWSVWQVTTKHTKNTLIYRNKKITQRLRERSGTVFSVRRDNVFT